MQRQSSSLHCLLRWLLTVEKTSFDLRLAQANDYTAVEALARQLYRVREVAHPTVFVVADAALIDPKEWQFALDDEDHIIAAAEVDGTVSGFVHASIQRVKQSLRHQERQYAVIEMMAVSPEHRRSGIGRGLVQHVQDWASEQGLSEVELEVYDANRDAIGLYEALGYRSIKRTMSIAVR